MSSWCIACILWWFRFGVQFLNWRASLSTEQRNAGWHPRPEAVYEIQQTVHTGPHSTTARVRDRDTGQTYLFWTPGDAAPASSLEDELDVLQILGRDSLVIDSAACGLASQGVLSPDPGGCVLTELIPAGGMPPERSLWIATRLVELLRDLHAEHVVHRALSSHAVWVDEQTRAVDLVCRCLASRVPRESGGVVHPGPPAQTLAYMAPEQTGRMNRAMDYRTDYYSLGVILYQLLTGRLPFEEEDLAALVHAHIARAPAPPAEVAAVPSALSGIVLKLMAKDPEDRYQSSVGVLEDLRRCARRLERDGEIGTFELGRLDVAEQFRVPQKLYGRQEELAMLQDALERADRGHVHLVLVSGYSGIGKTALVQEMHKAIAKHDGLYVSGKYDQFQRNIPFFALSLAFGKLLRQLLTGSDEELQQWRDLLTEALGENAGLMVDLVPELELVIGAQGPVEQLPPAEAEQRFTTVFTRFIRVFAGEQRTLVVFLDDLQWVDGISLKLIQHLAISAGDLRLLLVGAYRDNEVNAAHPLMTTVDEIKKAEVSVREIVLGPLSERTVRQLVTETLRCTADVARPLTGILARKTDGNPFFLIQFFEALNEEGLLRFDPRARAWTWDEAAVTSMESTENVIELMVSRLQKLSEGTQDVLKMASCIGATFDLATLAAVTGRPPRQTSRALWEAVHQEVIVPQQPAGSRAMRSARSSVEVCQFLHDRVQQAAASMISADELKSIHLRIGRLLRERTGKLDEHLFDIVSHLSLCTDLLESEAERRDVAGLALLAGQRAKGSTAYQAAREYLETGVALLGEDSWETDYSLTMSLRFELAECAYVSGENEEAEALFEQILGHARTELEKARLHKIRTNLALYDAKHLEALGHVIDGLVMLGVQIPGIEEAERLQEFIEEEGAALAALLEGKRIPDLVDLPEMTDPLRLMEAELLEELSLLGLFFSPLLVQLVTLRQVKLSVEHGNSPASPSAYASHGMTIGAALGQYEDGYAFGKMAVELAQRRQAPKAEAVARFWFGAFSSPWRREIQESVEILRGGVEIAQRICAPLWAAFASFFVPVHMSFAGTPLPELEVELERYLLAQSPEAREGCVPYLQLNRALRGTTESMTGFTETDWGDARIERMKEQNMQLPMQHYFLARLMADVYFGQLDDGLVTAKGAAAAGDINAVLFSQLATARYAFYHALVLADALREGAAGEKEEVMRRQLDGHRERLETWASNCPDNFAPMHHLVEAEHALLSGDQMAAMDGFDRAIDAASGRDRLHHLALAHERAARFHLSGGRTRVATLHLRAARTAYARWGAVAKVAALDEQHPALLPFAPVTRTLGARAEAHQSAETLDVASVLKTARIVSDETELDKMLDRSMAVVIENAGAQRGLLLLDDRAGGFSVEGAADTESLEAPCVEYAAAVVEYCRRTREQVVLSDATADLFSSDPYISANNPRSVLAMPLVHQGQLMGVLYLENRLSAGVFTPARIQVLDALCAQIAVSIDNERMYQAFLLRMSHELRTPLNAIIGYSEMLKEDLADEGMEDFVPDLDKIHGAGKHLLSVITDILDLSKMESGNVELYNETFAVAELVQEVVTATQPLVESNSNTLTVECPDDMDPMVADRSRLHRILFNLMSNAAKFTEGGQILFGVRPPWGGEKRWVFEVTDTGIGITPEQLQTVFRSFHQADNSTTRQHDGSGLGLTIAQRFCHLMGGEIRVRSELGAGTTMEVLLPEGSVEEPPAEHDA